MGCITKPIILTGLSWFLETCHILATRWNFWICFLQIATTCPVVRGLQTMFTLCLLFVETPRFPKASILVLATEMFENLFVWKLLRMGFSIIVGPTKFNKNWWAMGLVKRWVLHDFSLIQILDIQDTNQTSDSSQKDIIIFIRLCSDRLHWPFC